MDENVPIDKFLNCNHPVCMSCTKDIRGDLCPMCRAPLGGGYVTAQTMKDIKTKQEFDQRMRDLEGSLTLHYQLNFQNLNRPGFDFNQDATDIAKAFVWMVEKYPKFDSAKLITEFDKFADFMDTIHIRKPNKSFQDGIREYEMIFRQKM